LGGEFTFFGGPFTFDKRKLATGNCEFTFGNRKLSADNRQIARGNREFAIAGSVFRWYKADGENCESSAICHLNYCTSHTTNSKGLVTSSIYRSSYSSGHTANSIRRLLIV